MSLQTLHQTLSFHFSLLRLQWQGLLFGKFWVQLEKSRIESWTESESEPWRPLIKSFVAYSRPISGVHAIITCYRQLQYLQASNDNNTSSIQWIQSYYWLNSIVSQNFRVSSCTQFSFSMQHFQSCRVLYCVVFTRKGHEMENVCENGTLLAMLNAAQISEILKDRTHRNNTQQYITKLC